MSRDVSRRVFPSRQATSSPSRARRTTIRPFLRRPESRPHPRWRGRAGDPRHQAPHEPPAAVGCVDADQLSGFADPDLRDLRLSDRKVEDGADLSRDAQVAEEIGAVRLDLELEDGVARVELVEILSRGGAGVEDHNPRRVLPQAELDSGT